MVGHDKTINKTVVFLSFFGSGSCCLLFASLPLNDLISSKSNCTLPKLPLLFCAFVNASIPSWRVLAFFSFFFHGRRLY